MLKKLYEQTLALAARPGALKALALIAFVESSVFPIPPDVLLIPMILAERDQAWRIAGVCTLFSVLGGVVGYGLGFFLFETLGRPLLALYGAGDSFASFQAGYNEWGAWIVAGAELTPFPYKVVTILSGVTGMNLWTFILVSILARGARFFLEAGLLWYAGPAIREVLEKNLKLATTLAFALLFGGFILVRYVF